MSIENKKLGTILGPSEICPPFYICDEMKKLRKWLDKEGIEWEDNTEKNYCSGWMVRTYFTYKDNFVSVVNGYGSYGGFSSFHPKNEDLLEMMVSENEPIGRLTADQVITYLEKQCARS